VVTGVSGSGKCSLVLDSLGTAARDVLQGRVPHGEFRSVAGLEHFQRTIQIDQAPIGRTPRSTPASYSGILTFLRELYQALPEARARGYTSTRFSFNAKGGRCEKCRGDGVLRVEMHLLPDAFAPCDSCHGKRYNRETLQIRYRGSSIADALDMTVDEASTCFAAIPKIAKRLELLRQLGLGYLRLGQRAPTLSGGEAQRLKLATELAKAGTGPTLYLLDEPTAGLHHHDVGVLLHALYALRDEGNTVIAIEHHLDFAARADWIIDMGPEGGAKGGQIVSVGPVEDVAACSQGHTGRFLRAHAVPTTRRS
jgi:excinuclease ABC subunit A